ncbi:Uu.00g014110.m01.CDS01 [Anthostomella pinea]|uniref:Uu.00g014110.m01.CDS01 n=1 Tax=Anthostomella pinea TaxID=933095 RepID=A0AAI8YN22_9PEZI|nr:Uu.00g014110.m01.CDS01 [Anthostomella pinea]
MALTIRRVWMRKMERTTRIQTTSQGDGSLSPVLPGPVEMRIPEFLYGLAALEREELLLTSYAIYDLRMTLAGMAHLCG